MAELSWNVQKKELWRLNVKELEKKLIEMIKEKYSMEARSRGYTGDPVVPMSQHRVMNTQQSHVDIKGIRHKIACLKTMIREKRNETKH